MEDATWSVDDPNPALSAEDVACLGEGLRSIFKDPRIRGDNALGNSDQVHSLLAMILISML